MSARSVTETLGGKWCQAGYGLVPGPGHSARDRSVKVWDSLDGGVAPAPRSGASPG